MSSLYYNLVRCCAIVQRHEGSTLEALVKRGHKSRIHELKNWKMVNYFEKMIDDGVIYEVGGLYFMTPEQEGGSE